MQAVWTQPVGHLIPSKEGTRHAFWKRVRGEGTANLQEPQNGHWDQAPGPWSDLREVPQL